MPLVKIALVPVLLSLIFQRDIGLSKALTSAIDLCFGMNMSDGDGKCIGNVKVEKYPYSLAECSEEEKDYIYGCIPSEAISTTTMRITSISSPTIPSAIILRSSTSFMISFRWSRGTQATTRSI